MGHYKDISISEYHKKHYQKNKERIIANRRIYREKMKKEFLLNNKLNKGCLLCGYNEHPEILQFHHKNEEEKSFKISRKELSPELIKAEIEKCVLLCPNCHVLLHNKNIGKEKIK